MYNIFISYRRDGGYEMARLLYEHLKNEGLNPFFDMEELRSGPFNEKLYQTIDECPNFVLVLPPKGLNNCINAGDWVRLEIERALLMNKNIIPVMMQGFEWGTVLPTSISSLPNFNGVNISRDYFDASISKLVSMLKDVKKEIKEEKNQHFNIEREENKYFTFADKKEIKRLKTQQNLMKAFDKEVYDKVVSQYEELRVLDIGSNNGDFVIDRLGKSNKLIKLVGVEYDSNAVASANEKYAQENKIVFVQSDVESEEFVDKLEQVMADCDISTFNVVNISMVLLHLKSPYRVLKRIRNFVEKGGTIIIKDIDDGFNIAYPDKNGDFERVVKICAKNETSGYRHSGRQVFTSLKRAGYNDCVLEKLGLTTVGMSFDEKAALFDTYFSFILDDLKIMVERYPNDQEIQKDLEWYKNIYEDLEEQIQSDVFFSLGFMLFTAKK